MAAGNGATWPRAQRPQDRQAAHDAWRSSSLTQPPSRCSRSALLTLLIAPVEPDPEGLPGAGWLQLGSETAARTCQRAACGLPATAVLPAAGAMSVCQDCLLGPCCSGCIPVRTLFSPAAFGGVWGCWRCRAWHWAGAETCFVVRFEWSTGFEFLTVSFNATRSVTLSACLLYTSPSPRDRSLSRMPSSA